MNQIACYIRVSSKGQDYDTQRDALERALPAGVTVVWYQEKLSARTSNRPELKRLLSDVRAGKYSAVFVFKLDRLARSGIGDTFRVLHEIRESRTELHAVADNLVVKPNLGLNKTDIASECIVFALSLAAQLEFTARNDRIDAARLRIEAKGGAWGRPRTTTHRQDAKCLELKRSGKTLAEISEELEITRSTAVRAIKRAEKGESGAEKVEPKTGL